jgi:hypothetical protein
MSYKTKKNNKLIKKQIGGEINRGEINRGEINRGGEINNSMDKYQNVPPSLKSNLKKFADIVIQVFNNLGMYGLKWAENGISNTSKSFGINPNGSLKDEIVKVNQKVEKINEVLNTPEGQRALTNLRALFYKISTEVIIPSSVILAEQLIENLQPIILKGSDAVFSLLSASPFGAIFDMPRFVAESIGVGQKTMTLLNDVLGTVEDTTEKIKAEKNNFNSIITDIDGLMQKGNETLSNQLDYVKQKVDNPPPLQMGGFQEEKILFKKYQKEAKMLGGRIQKSKDEFTKNITIKHKKRKNKTRKHY